MANIENNNKNTFLQVLSYTADKAIEMAKESPVVGEKITVDGITVIPISKVSVGFAGGGADISDELKKKKKNPSGSGASVNVVPMSFLIIDGNDIRTVRIDAEKGKNPLADVIRTLKASKKKKEKKK